MKHILSSNICEKYNSLKFYSISVTIITVGIIWTYFSFVFIDILKVHIFSII